MGSGLGQTGLLVFLFLLAIEEITLGVVRGKSADLSSWLRFYIWRARDQERPRDRIGLPVAVFLWWLAFQHFGSDPVEDAGATLTSQGFDWLEPEDFEEYRRDPDTAWRRSFDFAEVRDGHAVERQRPGHEDGDDRLNVTDEVLGKLDDGGRVAVLGQPGAGKSTICRSVACRWYDSDDRGPVIYRRKGSGRPIEDVEGLHDAIEAAENCGAVLVVAEDVAREHSVPLFELAHEFGNDPDVHFLVDSRRTRWQNFDDVARGHGQIDPNADIWEDIQSERSQFELVQAPRLDEREVKRIVSRFEEKTGEAVHVSPEDIFEDIRTEHGVSPMLLLAYQLPVGEVTVAPQDEQSILDKHVEEVYHRVEEIAGGDSVDREVGGGDFVRRVAILINVLNAAEIGVFESLVHAPGESESEHREIDGLLDEFEGLLVFGEDGPRYQSNHELWSILYLKHLIDEKGRTGARNLFEDAVNALFALVDERSRRKVFRYWYSGDTFLMTVMDEDAEPIADWLVSSVFGIGVSWPAITPLYSTTEHSGIELPKTSSDGKRADCSMRRGEMLVKAGFYEDAKQEFDAFRDCALKAGTKENLANAMYLTTVGEVYFHWGKYDAAKNCAAWALELHEEMEIKQGQAANLNNLGAVAQAYGDLEAARKYTEHSLEIERDIGNRTGEATSLQILGIVAESQNDYESAWEYQERSLEIHRDLGDREGMAASLRNLGVVAQDLGYYDTARDYYEQSLEIERNIGNRAGEAESLDNLGVVAQAREDYEVAQEYHKQSLTIEQELGRQVGIAEAFGNLGSIAQSEGNHQLAQERFENAAEIFRQVGAVRKLLTTFHNLADVYEEMGNDEAATQQCQAAITLIRGAEMSSLEAEKAEFDARLNHLHAANQEIGELYDSALMMVLRNKLSLTLKLLNDIWSRFNDIEQGDETFPLVAAAGVGIVILQEELGLESKTQRTEDIMEAISPHSEVLPHSARPLWEFLIKGETDINLDDPRERVDTESEQFDREDLECLSYGAILEAVTSIDD